MPLAQLWVRYRTEGRRAQRYGTAQPSRLIEITALAVATEAPNLNVTLEIRAHHLRGGELADAIAVRLVGMGGRLTGWRPETNAAPARAYFTFDSKKERRLFLARALDISGVSMPLEPERPQQSGPPQSATV